MSKYAVMYKDNDTHTWVVEKGYTHSQALKQANAIRGSHIYVVTRTGLRRAG
jgi:hypothetical protein